MSQLGQLLPIEAKTAMSALLPTSDIGSRVDEYALDGQRLVLSNYQRSVAQREPLAWIVLDGHVSRCMTDCTVPAR
jgi:hypothetical protein